MLCLPSTIHTTQSIARLGVCFNPIQTIMTYYAPRQGLFAIITLISLSLHLLFFVITQDHLLNQQQQTTAQHKATLIANDVAIALNAQDRVGISVIAKRYLNDNQVDFIGVYDSDDNLIVPVGKETPQSVIIKEPITLNNQVLGSVAVHSHAVNRAEIISQNWLFVVAMLILHVIVCLIYGYIARPSKDMLTKIANDVRIRLLGSEPITASTSTDAPMQTIKHTKADEPTKDEVTHTHHDDNIPLGDERQSDESLPARSNYIMIQIVFHDPDKLLETIDYYKKSAYFSLCTQLLEKAIPELLSLQVLSGVSLFNVSDYSEQGAVAILRADNLHGKVATGAMMLGKLMVMLHQIVCDKHRELQHVGLPARALISDIERQTDILNIAQKHKGQVLILLRDSDLSQIQTYGKLDALAAPTTVSERDTRRLIALSETTAQRLEAVQNKILLGDDQNTQQNA